MKGRRFTKMHGLGNDFVILDAREEAFDLDEAATRAICDRRRGVGCDQLIRLEAPLDPAADVFMRIRNASGEEAEACGNATRCVAQLLFEEAGRAGRRPGSLTIQTVAGLLRAEAAAGGAIAVDMGPPRLGWQEIPLAEPRDTLHLGIGLEALQDPVGVSMGNPHAVFFVPDVAELDLARLGPQLEHHPLFPERANIGVAQRLGPDRLRLRVWERGAGLTPACGSGACAAAVAAHRRGLTGRRVTLELDGGPLTVEWRAEGPVVMTGAVALAFTGELAEGLLPAAAAPAPDRVPA